MDFFETMSFANIDWYEIWLASVDTFWMLGGSLLFTVVLGLPLGDPSPRCPSPPRRCRMTAMMRCRRPMR